MNLLLKTGALCALAFSVATAQAVNIVVTTSNGRTIVQSNSAPVDTGSAILIGYLTDSRTARPSELAPADAATLMGDDLAAALGLFTFVGGGGNFGAPEAFTDSPGQLSLAFITGVGADVTDGTNFYMIPLNGPDAASSDEWAILSSETAWFGTNLSGPTMNTGVPVPPTDIIFRGSIMDDPTGARGSVILQRVPEPSTGIFVLLGALGFFARRRR